MTDSCLTCRNALAIYKDDHFEYRRYAPRPVVQVEGDEATEWLWPKVFAHEWCGQFVLREGPLRTPAIDEANVSEMQAAARREVPPMSALPPFALSVRQPWAWAIVHAGKDIENRGWKPSNPNLPRRGRIAVHAASGMTRAEHLKAHEFMRSIGVACPPPEALQRAGIIGSVDVANTVTAHASAWFFGPRGLVLRDPQPCDFIPSIGQLGYFRWAPAPPTIVPAPARWMSPPALETPPRTALGRQAGLFDAKGAP